MQRNFFLMPFIFFLVFTACSPNNVTTDDSLKKYFDSVQVNGCFGLFDNGQGDFTIYNLPRFRDSAYLPASTFKIVNALAAIQHGTVKDETTVIAWDSVVRPIPEWNQDLTMKQAFNFSSVPWFQELARRTGREKLQHTLDTLEYAASKERAVIGKLDSFWLDNSIKITADEQLGLVKRLYFEQLPFYARTQQMVAGMMLREDNANYKLSYKTGLGRTESGHPLGWIIGWIEENNHPYFFVLQVESPDKDYDINHIRLPLLKKILKQYGFMEGRK